MSMRQLYDPILNDILLLVQGRKHQALSPMAVTRYQQHLDRLDVELRDARVQSKKPAIAYGDTEVAVASSTLATLRKRIADLTTEVQTAQAAVAQALSEHPEISRLADFLLQELDPRHFTGLEGSAVDVAIALLRRFTTETEETHDDGHPPALDSADGHPLPGPAGPAGAGAGGSRPRDRRAR